MSDEQMVSHEDLDAALEEAAAQETPAEPEPESTPETEPEKEAEGEKAPEPEPEKEPEPEPEPEPTDNRERSMLGRKVKSLSEELAEMRKVYEQTQALLNQATPAEPEESPAETYVATAEDVERIIEQREVKKREQAQIYGKTAESEIVNLGIDEGLDDETHVAVAVEAEKNWKNFTGDPRIDAKMNFDRALLKHYKTQVTQSKKPKNPLEKNRDGSPPPGGPTETSVEKKAVKPVKLDKHAAELAKSMGWDNEKVSKALEGDAPMGFRGTKY